VQCRWEIARWRLTQSSNTSLKLDSDSPDSTLSSPSFSRSCLSVFKLLSCCPCRFMIDRSISRNGVVTCAQITAFLSKLSWNFSSVSPYTSACWCTSYTNRVCPMRKKKNRCWSFLHQETDISSISRFIDFLSYV
jgi:hypothetical protein